MIQNVDEMKREQKASSQVLAGSRQPSTTKSESLLTAAMIESLLQQTEEIIELQTKEQRIEKNSINGSFGSNHFADHLDYMTLLSALNIEFRYGKGAQQHDLVEYVMHMFDGYMTNLTYRFKLEQLKMHNTEAFLTAIDVFTLCTMFAKHQNMSQLHNIAISFLFHNIGQLHVSDDLLTKHSTSMCDDMTVQLFHEMGIGNLSYIVKPHSQQQATIASVPMDVKLLHLIKTYVALTMPHPPKQSMHPYDAITQMYAASEHKHDIVLNAFAHFLGIFPENAVVLLSNGSQAIIESKGVANPLLPKVRSLQTNMSLSLPYDFSLHISKMVASNAMSLERLFTSLSEAICNAQYIVAKRCFEHLIRLYEATKWYTHIHIPLFKIIDILDKNDVLLPEKRDKMKEMYRHMMKETKVKLNEQLQQHEIVLILVDDDMECEELVSLLEGLLYLDAMYPIVIRNEKSSREIKDMMERLNIRQLFVLSEQQQHTIYERATACHFNEKALEQLLMTFSEKKLQAGDVRSYFQRFHTGAAHVS